MPGSIDTPCSLIPLSDATLKSARDGIAMDPSGTDLFAPEVTAHFVIYLVRARRWAIPEAKERHTEELSTILPQTRSRMNVHGVHRIPQSGLALYYDRHDYVYRRR